MGYLFRFLFAAVVAASAFLFSPDYAAAAVFVAGVIAGAICSHRPYFNALIFGLGGITGLSVVSALVSGTVKIDTLLPLTLGFPVDQLCHLWSFPYRIILAKALSAL